MSSPDDLAAFIASSFRSVWALELLLLLKRDGRGRSSDELVAALRASPSVVEKALDSLVAAGLVASDGDDHVYMPINADVAELVSEAEQLYGSRPNRVRRLIVASSSKSSAAFSDAFRLKD